MTRGQLFLGAVGVVVLLAALAGAPAEPGEVVPEAASPRLRAVAWAARELAQHASAPRLDVYWHAAGLPAASWQSDTMPPGIDWCGIFVDAALRSGGVHAPAWKVPLHATDVSGIIQPAHLPQTMHPEPGDISYQNEPPYHQALVESVNGDVVTLINGNAGSPAIQRSTVKLSAGYLQYYSIAPLLGEA